MLTVDDWYCTIGYELLNFVLPQGNFKIGGKIKNCELVKDGSHIKTMKVISFKGKKIKTMDDVVWKLDKIHPLYKEFLINEDWTLDMKNPLKRAA